MGCGKSRWQKILRHVLLAIPTHLRASTIGKMSAAPAVEIPQSVPVPRLLIELPLWPQVFRENLRDLIFAPTLAPLELRSTPAPFWSDVFVNRPLPWNRFFQSGVCHVIAFALLLGFTRFFALQPRVIAKPAFDHSQIIVYRPSEYLPPIDTRSSQQSQSAKGDPEFSRQPVISVPAEADNRSQTIVTPPNIKLNREVKLPNIVAWSDTTSERMLQPRLAIPPVPLTPAAEISRLAPKLEDSVAPPPPDAAHLAGQRSSPTLRNAVLEPPPDVRASNAIAFQAPQPAFIAPPPTVETAFARPIGELNIGPSSIIAPAPQLPLADQRTISGARSASLGAPQVAPPPPSVASAGSTEEFGARGRIIALNLHPAIGAPSNPPAGNRRGVFAATPEGRAGASGSPAISFGSPVAVGSGNGTTGSSRTKGTNDIPSGLYVGSATTSSTVAGGKSSRDTVNPNLIASVRPPRVAAGPSRTMQAAGSKNLSDEERAVFGDRKFYSLTLNMPNLNSAGGSWVIRFAELDHSSNASNREPNSSAGELAQPAATRKVDPAYPLQLMRENVAGTVILYAVIHADGSVGGVRILRGVDDRLDQFASQAVAQWQFHPATKQGVPVDVEATFQIPFRPARLETNF
jgi:TonB family protein